MKAQHIAVIDGPHQLKPGQWTVYRDTTYARCPNGLLANLEMHRRHVEFDQTDGMRALLTVSPSIDCDNGTGGLRFHGFIEKGIWLDADHRPIESASTVATEQK